ERLLALADPSVKVGQAREHLFVRGRAALELAEDLQRAGAVPSLHERFALLEDELRIVRRRADESFVLGDGLVELPLRLQEADQLEAKVDVSRILGERLLVR